MDDLHAPRVQSDEPAKQPSPHQLMLIAGAVIAVIAIAALLFLRGSMDSDLDLAEETTEQRSRIEDVTARLEPTAPPRARDVAEPVQEEEQTLLDRDGMQDLLDADQWPPEEAAGDNLSERQRPDCNAPQPPRTAGTEIPGIAYTIGPFLGPGTDSLAPLDGQWLRGIAPLDDGRIASVTYDDQLMIWDPATPFEAPQYSAVHSDTTWEVAAGPGSLVIVGDANGLVLVYDADNPDEPIDTFDWYDDWPMTVSVMCDGRLIAANDSSTITIWDPYTRERRTLRSPSDHVRAVQELSDGRLVTTGLYRFVHIWDLDDGSDSPMTLDADFDSFPEQIIELDNGLLAISDGEARVRVWDADGTFVAGFDQDDPDELGHYTVINDLPGGRVVITTTGGAAIVWEPSTDTIQELAPGTIDEDVELNFDDSLIEIVATPDGYVVANSVNGINRIWQVGSDIEAWPTESVVEPVIVTTTFPEPRIGDRLAVLDDGRVFSTDWTGIRLTNVAEFVELYEPTTAITAIAWSDGNIAAGHADGSVSVERADGSTSEFALTSDGSVVALALASDTIYAAATAPGADGSTISVIDPDGTLRTETTSSPITTLTYLDRSDVVLAGTNAGDVLRVDPQGLTTSLAALDGSAVAQIVELPDGRAAVGTDVSTIWVLDPTSGDLTEHDHPLGPPTHLLVAQDRLFTSGGTGVVRVWDADDLDAEPIVVDTGAEWPPVALLPAADDTFAFNVVDGAGRINRYDLEGTSEQVIDLAAPIQFGVVNPTTNQMAVATSTGIALVILDPGVDSVGDATSSTNDDDGGPQAVAGEVDIVWSAEPVENPGLTNLEGASWLFGAHQRDDGTVIGIGGTAEEGSAVWLWPPGQEPTSMALDEIGSLLASTVVDDSWLILSLIDPWDPEGDEDATGRLEYWDLDALDAGPQYVEPGTWALGLTELDDGRFLVSDTAEQNLQLTIRTVADFDDVQVVSEQAFARNAALLNDGRIAVDGIAILDPQEPERSPILVPNSTGSWEFDVLPDGRIIWGEPDGWGLYDPETKESQTFAIDGADHVVLPHLLSDGRIAINGADGIVIVELDDPETPVAFYPTPDGTNVSSAYLNYTDTHAISFGEFNGELWVWDLNAPDVPATTFEGGEPLVVLADGDVVSNSDSGLIRWNPASVIRSGTRGQEQAVAFGRLCDSASPAAGTIWYGTEQGTVLAWNWQDDPAGEPTVAFAHGDEITEMLIVDGMVATASHDGTVRLTDPVSGERITWVEHPGGAVTSMAVLADGRIAAGAVDGTIIAFDPDQATDIAVIFEGQGSSAAALSGLPDGRIGVGLVENQIRVIEAVPGGAQQTYRFPSLPFSQLATSDGLLLVPGSNGVAVYDPSDTTDRYTTMSLPREGYAVPVELADGRIVTISDDGAVWVNDRSGSDDRFTQVGSIEGTSFNCLTALDDGHIAYVADGRAVAIMHLGA